MLTSTIDEDFIRKILRKTGNLNLLDYYEKKNNLTDDHKKTLIRSVAKFMVDHNDGKHPQVRQKRKAAEAITALFPNIFPDPTVLVGTNSRDGRLGFSFNNYVNASQKKLLALLDSEDETDDIGEAIIDEDFDDIEGQQEIRDQVEDEFNWNVVSEEGDDIRFLRTVVISSNNRSIVLEKLSATRDFRYQNALEGNANYIFDIFRHEPRLMRQEFHCLFADAKSFLAKKEVFFDFIQMQSQAAKRNFALTGVITHPQTEPFEKLIVLLGRAPYGAKAAVAALVTCIDGQATIEEIGQKCRSHPFPFIILKKSTPIQFIISLDGKPIYLSPLHFPNFCSAFDLVFKIFFIFNIKHPIAAKKVFNFFETAIYEMDKTKPTSPGTQELVLYFQRFDEENERQATESEEEAEEVQSEEEPQSDEEYQSEGDEMEIDDESEYLEPDSNDDE